HYLSLGALADSFRISNVMNGVTLGLKQNSLKFARQESVRPLAGRDRLQPRFARRSQHHEPPQLLGLSPNPIKEPAAHTGPAFNNRPSVHKSVRRVMIDLLGMHRTHNADIVSDTTYVREYARDLLTRFPIFFEFGKRSPRFQLRVLQLGELLSFGEGLRKR